MIRMKQDEMFISCDWGTSSFRLRLVRASDFRVLADLKRKDGNSAMDQAFRDSGETDRSGYYLSYLDEQVASLEAAAKQSLDELPILISGMASSTIGIKELPYKPLPYALDGSDLTAESLGNISGKNEVFLISGVRSQDDVMRGEEVQVVGCGIESRPELQLMLHPGTHAKHIQIEHGQVTGFHTYMTGELFALLSEKSILAGSVKKAGDGDAAGDEAFRDGVRTGNTSNIVHSLFLVRTNQLFRKLSPEENYRYLSGLLIGHELRGIPESFCGRLYLAGEAALVHEYELALQTLGISSRLKLSVCDGDEATFKGQYAVYSRHKNRS